MTRRPEKTEANYRIVTPLFCGGAEQQAEFRLASFKGVLRYWWRALEWGRIHDLAQMHREEAALFGSSDGGQSRFLMRLEDQSFGAVLHKGAQLKDYESLIGQGARYLGYGAIEAYASRTKGTKEAELDRSCFPAGGSIRLTLRFSSGATEEQRSQIETALKIAGLLGGIGSKSRKGYGSLTLTRLTRGGVGADESSWCGPKTLHDFRDELADLLRRESDEKSEQRGWQETPLTALTKDSRILLIEGRADDSAMHLLDRIGREFVRYRSWGRNGMVLGSIPREENFRSDHDLMKQDWKTRMTYPKRVAFGLPHNYGKPEQHLDVTPADEKLDRRASPLFIHIHQADGSVPLGVLAFLPTRFLPAERDRISVGGRDMPLQSQGFWEPIENFLNRLLDKSKRKEFAATDHIEQVKVAHG